MSNELEMIKLVAMVIALVAFVNFPIIIKRRKDFIKFLPGITCLIMLFMSSFLEDAFRIFEILKNVFALVGAILLLVAARIEFKKEYLEKNKFKIIKKPNNNEVKELND